MLRPKPAKRKRVLMRDMLTGELRPLRLKSGDGRHIRLHRPLDEPRAIPGMAHFEGSGPDGKHCRDCFYFGDLEIAGSKWRKPRVERDACARAKHLMDNTVQPGGLSARRACKYFMESPTPSEESSRDDQDKTTPQGPTQGNETQD